MRKIEGLNACLAPVGIRDFKKPKIEPWEKPFSEQVASGKISKTPERMKRLFKK